MRKLLFFAILSAVLAGCKQTEYVPVVETHDVHHWHTDSVKQKDSVYHEKTTTIMQLDSAAMAAYGIKLKSAERAWLVKTAELERQIERLMAMSATKDSVHDSIPYPVEVIKEVPREPSGIERILMMVGILAIMIIIICAVWKLRKFLPL